MNISLKNDSIKLLIIVVIFIFHFKNVYSLEEGISPIRSTFDEEKNGGELDMFVINHLSVKSNRTLLADKDNSIDDNCIVCVFKNLRYNESLNVYFVRIKSYNSSTSFIQAYIKIMRTCEYIRRNILTHNRSIDSLLDTIHKHNLVVDHNKELSSLRSKFVKGFLFLLKVDRISCFVFKTIIKNETDVLKNERIGFDKRLNRRESDKFIICFGRNRVGMVEAGQKKLTRIDINDMYGHCKDICFIKNVGIIVFVSAALMLITALIYCTLPRLRSNVYGKCVVLYLLTMVVAFTCFGARLSFSGKLGRLCQLTGFVFQFTWIASFTWQSVMCFDILLALSALRWRGFSTKKEDLKKLLLYSLYAYGIPAAITLTTIILQFGPFLKETSPWKPNIGGEYCFFQNDLHSAYKARWLYFCGPYSVIIIINVIMFIGTAIQIRKHSQAVNNFTDCTSSRCSIKRRENELIQVHLTLFFVMGTNWILEVVSVIRDNAGVTSGWVFRMVDYFNAGIGVILFLVLICKAKVFRELKYKITGKIPSSQMSIATGQEDLSSVANNHIKPSTSFDSNLSIFVRNNCK